MRIAYLILCHKNPMQVLTLIQQLNAENVDFYVHIDKKNSDFKLPELNNLFVLPIKDRVDVRWATNSMIYATLNLIHAAFSTDIKYDRFCLLSGQDFPIKSNAEIHSYLCSDKDANFIEILDKESSLYRRYCKRNELYYPSWMCNRTITCKIIKKLYIYMTGGYNKTFSLFKRKNPWKIRFEFGSQWWCLTYDCLHWIVEHLEKNKDFLGYFDNALTPDECIFQTVFMMSPFSNTAKDKLTFLEWDSNGNNPRVLTKADYHMLKNCENLFARKFDQDKDDVIIQLLIEANRSENMSV